MSTHEFLQANEKYAANFEKPDRNKLFRNVIIVTCMDPRIDPYNQLGLKIGEAITIRNAGGSAKEALRSIIVAQHAIGVLGEIAVFHHRDCGMSRTTTEQVRGLVKKANPGRDDIAATVDSMEFHHIIDIEESVRTDVKFLAENPLLVKGTKISGWVYDVETGKISQVLEDKSRGLKQNRRCRDRSAHVWFIIPSLGQRIIIVIS
ncbi:Protein kinase domain-containing protein [Mycena venus]|uniref:Carbonic anhydrase n=1 Tax=Mycena venus TaxID=2733690 RepID=A0A8H6XGF9_9AGAR|nr:Protein kinase domain-containing protein [Mycena venus]